MVWRPQQRSPEVEVQVDLRQSGCRIDSLLHKMRSAIGAYGRRTSCTRPPLIRSFRRDMDIVGLGNASQIGYGAKKHGNAMLRNN